MAKFCSQCGRKLPEGVEICPVCHKTGQEQGAALFTQMTAETEVWKEPDKPQKKIRWKPGAREKALLYTAAVLLVVITAFLILFTQPGARVLRAVKAGEYEKAINLYNDKLLGKGKSVDESIGKLLGERAEALCRSFEDREVGLEEAEQTFKSLYAFGLNTDAIDAAYQRFSVLKGTKNTQDEAEKLIISEKYLEACDLLLSIPESDAAYAEAQERAQTCLEMYSAGVMGEAETLMAADRYAEAIRLLETGEEKLMEYGTYVSYIDSKITECCESYESYALEEAENLVKIGGYDGAANLILSCIQSVGEREALVEAFDRYSAMAEEKTAAETISRANTFYDDGQVADAFLELEAGLRRMEGSEELTDAVTRLERRYATDTINKALETLSGDRDKIDEALAVLTEAQSVRELEALSDFADKLESYRPLLLVSADYSERTGEIYRSNTEFEALGGTVFTDGWIWGADESSVSFELGGGYDLLQGKLAVRRDDGEEVSGHFEIWCDGERVYASETMGHNSGPWPFHCAISGCQTLKLVFFCDYETSTALDGFCYHGLCEVQALKDMDDNAKTTIPPA